VHRLAVDLRHVQLTLHDHADGDAPLGRVTLSLSGLWGDEGSVVSTHALVLHRWFALPSFDAPITLPGSLPGHGIGDRVGLDTPWTGGIADRSFFNLPSYAPYREPDNFKIPFWLQPETYYAHHQTKVREPDGLPTRNAGKSTN
jgi:hypothetical protein